MSPPGSPAENLRPTPPLDPLTDFRDDGGTPMWRARQLQHARVIDISRPGLRGWWHRSSPGQIFLTTAIVLICVFAGVIAGGFASMIILDALQGVSGS